MYRNGEAAIITNQDRTPPVPLMMTGCNGHLLEICAKRMLHVNALVLKAKDMADKLGRILPGLEAEVDKVFEWGCIVLNRRSSKLTVCTEKKYLVKGE